MKLLIGFFALMSVGLANLAMAEDENGQLRFQSFVSILGPVNVSPELTLKLCSTDVSLFTRTESGAVEKRWSKRFHDGRSSTDRVVWSSTRIEIFDSTDTMHALPVATEDLIFPTGKGACTEVVGYDLSTNGISRTVVIVLTTLTEARAIFDPLVSGQLIAPNTTSQISLITPAVQTPETGADTCCACVPVCGCGAC